jgi:hypothetical protein
VCNFPLGGEVVEEQDDIEELVGSSLRILPVVRS